MFITRKRVISQIMLTATLAFAGVALAACGEDTTAAPPDNAGGAAPPAAASKPAGGYEQALAYAECMRTNGVPDFPDPQEENGRVRINQGNANPNSKEFQGALAACRDKMPQGQGGPGGGSVDAAKATEWAKCLRENGVPKLPDPEVEGNNITIKAGDSGISPNSPEFTAAMSACQDKYPGGALRVERGQ